MAEYSINKGIGREVEFRGLEAQYLFIFAAGLLAVFFLFVIMYMIGINQWFCIGTGIVLATILVWLTFRLNAKYGRYGLMKKTAAARHPRRISYGRVISRLYSVSRETLHFVTSKDHKDEKRA